LLRRAEAVLDAPVGRQNDRAVPHAIRRFDAFGEVDFSGLGIGHG